MPIRFDGTEVDAVRMDNTNLEKLIVDGTTVWEAFNPSVGETLGDGTIVVGILNGYWIISAPGDEVDGAAGTYGYTVGATSNTDGLTNSSKMLNAVEAGLGIYNYLTNAFEIADNATYGGHTDWYVPSIDEAKLIYQNGLSKTVNANSGWCIVSTEFSSKYIMVVNYSTGSDNYGSKDNKWGLRLFRRVYGA